jgi:hypothetical protein
VGRRVITIKAQRVAYQQFCTVILISLWLAAPHFLANQNARIFLKIQILPFADILCSINFFFRVFSAHPESTVG